MARMALALAAAAVALAWSVDAASGQAPAARAAATGYLSPSQMPDVTRIVPAAPTTGDSRFTADMALFGATRALQGSPRWALALADDDVTTAGLFRAFQCALGANLARENAPLVTSLVARANVDANRASETLKQLYKHKRPYQLVDAPVCVAPDRKASLARTADYPSGHTTLSWEAGLVLSEVAPEHATALLARARAFGESRVVCGVHNLSAVEAGWVTASAVFAAQQSAADFQSALTAARAEFAGMKQNAAPDTATCAAETALLEKDPF